jgi:hypothetical protein
MGVQPAAVSTVPLHARPGLLENSVAVMSRSQPGVFYSMNDSDNEPLVFALDTTGHDRGLWRVTNATNIDWESASLGPCGDERATTCLYIGDTGDNESVYQRERSTAPRSRRRRNRRVSERSPPRS